MTRSQRLSLHHLTNATNQAHLTHLPTRIEYDQPVHGRTVRADRGDQGRRLDLVVCRHLADVDLATRTRVQKWIDAGDITVNGTPARRPAMRVVFGDRIDVSLPVSEPRHIAAAENLPLDVLHEDDWLLAVNKPAGVVVHPAYKHPGGTLLNALLWHARTWPPDLRPTIVGRLDRLTSGIVVVAKSRPVHAALQHALARGEKVYLALVHGRVSVRRGTIDLPLGREAVDRRRVIVSSDGGRPSVTRFERIATTTVAGDALTLLRCRLVTGRMHQIRVHLAARGWPIVGDRVYGAAYGDRVSQELLRAFPRQALHAWRTVFVHPISAERMAIECPIATDMSELLNLMGIDGPLGAG